MKDPADLTPEEARDLEARLDAEFPIEGMRLEISTLRFQLANRTKERDEARAQVEALQAANDTLEAGNLTLARRVAQQHAENERLRDRVTELDAAITAYMLGDIDGGEVSRVQHRQWFPSADAES